MEISSPSTREIHREVIDTALVDGHTIACRQIWRKMARTRLSPGVAKGQRVCTSTSLTAPNGIKKRALDEGGNGRRGLHDGGDLNADRRVDVICIGSATQNLRWYENVPAR